MPQDPQLISLKKPEKLSEALKADKQDDCLSCRLMGTNDYSLERTTRATCQFMYEQVCADMLSALQAPLRSSV